MHVLSEQIKLTFKINAKSHPWYEGRQACSSGMGGDILRWSVEESSPPSFWPSVHVPFYLLSPIISLLLEDICYCLITRTVSGSTVLVGSQGFWQLWGAAASWTVSHLIQSWGSTSLPWACGWVGGCQEFEVRAIPAWSCRSLRWGLFLHWAALCQLVCMCAKASSTPPPAATAGPLGAGSWWVSWHSSRTGSGAAGRNVPHTGFCLFLLHFQGMQFTH